MNDHKKHKNIDTCMIYNINLDLSRKILCEIIKWHDYTDWLSKIEEVIHVEMNVIL